MAFPATGDTTTGSNALLALASTSDISIGMIVTCASFPAGTLVTSVDSSVAISLSNNATATSTGVAVSFATRFASQSDVVVTITGTDLTVRNNTFSSSESVTVTPDLAGISLTVRNVSFSSSERVTVKPDPSGITLHKSFDFTSVGNSVIVESESSVSLDMQFSSKQGNNITVTADVSLDKGMVGIGVCHVMREVMSLWGVEEIGSVNNTIRERALNDLNASLQMIWSHSKDREYWTRATIQVTVTAGSPSYLFDDTVQNVIGQVLKVDDYSPLIPLTTLGDVKSYDKRFRGGLTHGLASGDVEAYYIDRRGQTGNDPVKVTLEVAPTPITDTDLQVDVVKEAPRFRWSDYCECTHIPIPHQYVESLLIPICKFKAMSHRLFYRKESIPAIEREYQIAMRQLDYNDPQSLPVEEEPEPITNK